MRLLFKLFKYTFFFCFTILVLGFLLPHKSIIPVEKASSKDWNPESFWYYPWGKSVTHKGIDIFAKEGTPVNSATNAVVLYAGKIAMGGNVVLTLNPKWRLHYYAHLKEIKVEKGEIIHQGEALGTVGTSGNAKGKPPHLHYTVATIVPYPWRIDSDRQGWKKMFYLNPATYFYS